MSFTFSRICKWCSCPSTQQMLLIPSCSPVLASNFQAQLGLSPTSPKAIGSGFIGHPWLFLGTDFPFQWQVILRATEWDMHPSGVNRNIAIKNSLKLSTLLSQSPPEYDEKIYILKSVLSLNKGCTTV